MLDNREILGGLELDVYIPAINFAIEWNGIFHLKNIRGNLEKVKTKDKIKSDRCRELNIELLVIEDEKSCPKFITKTIQEIINVIEEKIHRAEVRVTNENSKSSE